MLCLAKSFDTSRRARMQKKACGSKLCCPNGWGLSHGVARGKRLKSGAIAWSKPASSSASAR
eukprot:scaffold52186_cov29-Tisochrysis_lutea.AAC.8